MTTLNRGSGPNRLRLPSRHLAQGVGLALGMQQTLGGHVCFSKMCSGDGAGDGADVAVGQRLSIMALDQLALKQAPYNPLDIVAFPELKPVKPSPVLHQLRSSQFNYPHFA